MTLSDQRVNIEMIFSVYSINVTNLFRPNELGAIRLLVQEIHNALKSMKCLSWHKKGHIDTLGVQFLKTATICRCPSCRDLKRVLGLSKYKGHICDPSSGKNLLKY